MQKLLQDFVGQIKQAAALDDKSSAIRSLLTDSQLRKADLADAIAALPEDEVMLYEGENCSIWTCRYNSDTVFAPHDHGMSVHVAVYRGCEVEVHYTQDKGNLRHGGNSFVSAGDVIRMGPDAIHAITADGSGQSHAIHVYEGPLTQVERCLYDWTTGAKVEFTMANFHALARKKADMKEFS